MIGDTLWVSKDDTSRVLYRVSKALRAMGLLGRCLVLCEGNFYNVAVTYKIPNYPYAFPETVCGDHIF